MRFKEDTTSWVKNTLKEICTFYKGVGISKDDLSNDGKECILYGQLYTTYKNEIIRVITSKTNLDSKDLFCSKYNDVIIPASGETPEDIATACCVLKDGVLLGGDLNIIRPSDKINGCFLSYQLNGKRKFDIAKISQGASIVHLHNDDLKKLNIFFPSNIVIQNQIVTLLEKIDTIIETQNKIISALESQINSIRKHIMNIISSYENKKIVELESQNLVTLKRGNVIPKHEYDENNIYPVYSSSTHNNGLMGYSTTFMFDKELITWSVDGGGNFFYRPKHKFNVTNVSGILEADANVFNYRFISEILMFQHSKQKFDYQTKAHPSVIEKLYSIPIIPIEEQQTFAKIFDMFYKKLDIEKLILQKYKEQKKFLLSNMFI